VTPADSLPPLTGTVTVGLPIEQAFTLFSGSIDTWWPHQFHIGRAEVAEVILEPGVGGRWYERGVDGSECDWGRVRTLQPPDRLVFTWQINGSFQFDPDPDHASEIDVQFTATGPAETTVTVEHRHFERIEGGQAVHDTIRGGGSWKLLLDGYVARAAETET